MLRDDLFLEVSAEVEIANPGRPERGRVWVRDSAVRWECRLGSGGPGLEPAQAAAAIGASVPQAEIIRAGLSREPARNVGPAGQTGRHASAAGL